MNQALKSRVEQPTHTQATPVSPTGHHKVRGPGAFSPSAVVARSARAEEVVVAARRLLEEEGAEALTMRRLAEQVGIKAPSLYKHLPDKAALEAAIIATGLEEAAATFETAVDGAAGDGAGAALSGARCRVSGVRAGPSASLPADAQRSASATASAGRGGGPGRGSAAAGCREPGAGPGRCGRSPTAWSCSSSTSGSRPTPTWTRPGRPASPRSRRADLVLVWSPRPAWIG